MRNIVMPRGVAPWFYEGHGYNSVKTGNYWIFVGLSETGMYYFWRPGPKRMERLTETEALACFDACASKGFDKEAFEEGLRAYDNIVRNGVTI